MQGGGAKSNIYISLVSVLLPSIVRNQDLQKIIVKNYWVKGLLIMEPLSKDKSTSGTLSGRSHSLTFHNHVQ